MVQSAGVTSLRGKRLCEVGCGDGTFLQLARARGAEVYGVEADESALEHLRRFSVVVSLEEDARRFDVVCAFQLLEHLTDISPLVRWLSKVLSQDGRVLVALPNGQEMDRLGSKWVGYRVDLEHVNYFNLGSLGRLLEQCGVLIEHYWEYGQPALQRAGSSNPPANALVRIIRGFLETSLGATAPRFKDGRYHLAALGRKA